MYLVKTMPIEVRKDKIYGIGEKFPESAIPKNHAIEFLEKGFIEHVPEEIKALVEPPEEIPEAPKPPEENTPVDTFLDNELEAIEELEVDAELKDEPAVIEEVVEEETKSKKKKNK